MTDFADLNIRIRSIEAELAKRRLDGLTRSGGRAERATDGLTTRFKALLGPLLATVTATAALTKTLNVAREFDVLNAQLVTATGNSKNAAVAFEAIEDFATKTPFDLAQVTNSFVKLVNLGLTPSERALTSYGNTASAMGKDLNQLIEAVADAATGEFERLKEFGIKARNQGDTIAFRFRGVTTTVKNNAAEIEKYLIGLGENEFAGAMAERVKTLDGALSNLGDEWNKLFRNIAANGVGEVMEATVRKAINILEELNAFIASGAFDEILDGVLNKFAGFGEDIARTLDIISTIFGDSSTFWGQAGQNAVDLITEAFKNLPENIRAIVQLITIELSAFVDYAKEYGAAFGEVLGTEFAKIVEKAKVYGRAIGESLNPFGDDSFNLESELQRLDRTAADITDKAFKRAEKNVELVLEGRRQSIISVIEEREVAVESFEKQVSAAEKLRKAYDEQIKARRANTKDRLEQFNQGGDSSGPSDAEKKEFKKLQDTLRTEEEVIQDSYNKRLEIILKNTKESSDARNNLVERLNKQFAVDALGDLAAPDTFQEQLDELNRYYSARRELILNNTKLTEEQRTELEEELTRQRNEKLQQLELQRISAVTQSGEQLFGSLADLSKNFAGEQSGIYRVLFAASKAFAIADAIIKIQQGIANAAVLPFPANIGAMASVAAATASIVSTIQGQQFAGAFDSGGRIGAGQFGLVGEFGPELVSGPANVTSREDTMKMLKEQQPAKMPQINLTNVNLLDQSALEAYLKTSGAGTIVMNHIRDNPETIKSVINQ